MQSLFGFHETLEVVTNRVPVLAANASDTQKIANTEAKKKYCKVVYCIQTAVDTSNFMGEDEKVVEYVLKVQKLVHLLKGYGETLTNKIIVKKDFQKERSSRFDTSFAGSVMEKNGGYNKFKGKVDKTQDKKPWLNSHKQVKDRTSESSKGEEGNYRKDKEDKKGKGVQCYNCKKRGHLSKHCWYRKDNRSTKGGDEGANLARQNLDDSEGMMVMAAVADNHIESKIWFLESGCSNNMTGQKVWLTYFDESKKRKVKLADNSSLQAEGTSNIVFQMSNGGKAMIKDVIYVHGIK
ncbi:uncharacterized protein LOC131659715 [Vicia villosa]|uniref:uncharacterized protein LOC131659715 n=1 Tax=Vicia villosa TaxID=3911 RepID=UPI00273C3A9D|nr:uncharacterized protein LOC131659715 [Vicia villosa]